MAANGGHRPDEVYGFVGPAGDGGQSDQVPAPQQSGIPVLERLLQAPLLARRRAPGVFCRRSSPGPFADDVPGPGDLANAQVRRTCLAQGNKQLAQGNKQQARS